MHDDEVSGEKMETGSGWEGGVVSHGDDSRHC